MENPDLRTAFKEKAAIVSAVIHEVSSLEDALTKSVDLCKQRQTAKGLPSSPSCTMAAPDLADDLRSFLEERCKERDVTLLSDSLRNHGNGVDVGITFADFGIAETGTLVVSSNSEEKRLASMLSEVHVALLPSSRIRSTALNISNELKALTAAPGAYMAFITGPSRTADIERVLAIGVHGPLELHIMLYDDPADG